MSRLPVRGAALVAVLAAASTAHAAQVTVPKGTSVELRVDTAFDNDTAVAGQAFRAHAARALWIDGQLVIPAGAVVKGEVKLVKNAKDGSKSGVIAVKFEDLDIGGTTHDIEGVLTSLQDDQRKQILEQHGKISTGRKVDVVLIGSGTEAGGKVSTLVGISGADDDELAEGWAKSGLGPLPVRVTPGTEMAMELDASVSLPAQAARKRGASDRSLSTSSATVKAAQEALRTKGFYKGEANGALDTETRIAIARYQLEQKQRPTGDADAETLAALGVRAR